MKTIIRQSLLLVLFWFVVFFIGRLTFYICILPLLKDVPPELMFRSLYKGLRLDVSMIGYLLSVPLLLMAVFYIIRKQFAVKLIAFLNYSFIVLYVLTIVGEACLYREWHAKLSIQALQHFAHPGEVIKSATAGLTLLFFGLTFGLVFIFIQVYSRRISPKFSSYIQVEKRPVQWWKGAVFLLVSIAFSFISIRGGLQPIPIQSSDAAFCAQPIANDAAVNPMWNIIFNLVDYQAHSRENPFKDMPQDEADNIVKNLYAANSDSTIYFLDNKRPNIVYIILESWSANVIQSFGGDNFAPFTDSLSRQGIRFTKIYPPAYVSDQGIPSILSGYPSVSRISVINQSEKSKKLPCISHDLKKYGYQSGFLFGGDLNYGNIKSYIYNKEFDVIKEESNFNNNIPRGKLGIQDGEMQHQYLQELNLAKPPFVYAWFTLSTHMPYDFPGEKKRLVKGKENDYINSIAYADNALRNFFNEAKKQAWYKNTLFVLVADHSHATHKNQSVFDPEFHRIPLVFFGDVINEKWKGKAISSTFSQADVTATILAQMDLKTEAKAYNWSKNIFDPKANHFAYFCSFEGCGIVTDNGCVGYQHTYKELVINRTKNQNATDSLLKTAKAYQQAVYEDFRLK
ncbi:MAG: alkaline phosphatase family protein [Sphingobacteriales bacterium]|nr:MAG: alkaline phosphatase family protein [Sphingobacteriales bacterium]